MATIPGVADGELVRTTWGDAVADELNLRCVKKTAAQTMAGPLTVSGAVIAGSTLNVAGAVTAAGMTTTGTLQVGGVPYAAGVSSYTDGRIRSSINSTTVSNLICNRDNTAMTVGQNFAAFTSSLGANVLGTIAIVSGSAIAFNSSSDYRLKDDLGPIEAPVDQLMLLQPKRLRWKIDGIEFDGFIAHEVDDVVPYAVSGDKDAMSGDDIAPQQLDTGKLIPLLTAALQDAHLQIADLTARLEALEEAAA